MSEPGKYVLLKNVQPSSKKIKKSKQKKDNQLKKKLEKVVSQKGAGQVSKRKGKIPPPNEGASKKKKKNKQKQEAKKNLPQEVPQNSAKNKKPKQQINEEPINFHDDLADRLKAARFRFINEQLYTQTGEDAIKVFNEDDSAFNTYHDGYRIQVNQWPINPLDRIIKSIKKLYAY